MLMRRETKLDWISAFVYCLLSLPSELRRIYELFPEDKILEVAGAFYDGEMGRPSEDPVFLTKIMFLSFFYDIKGDKNTLLTLKYRIDWRQFCGLSLFASLPDRTTLVKFRRRVGAAVIDALFKDFVQTLIQRGLLDRKHSFFDGTPAKARASINSYRDEIYEKPLEVIETELKQNPSESVELDPGLNPSPVELEKTTYPLDNAAVKTRREQPMKPVSERQSAGDPDAHFQRGKHGKPSELGYEIFFTTDSKQLFIEQVDVSAKASQGQAIFGEKLDQSDPGQEWSVDAEFSSGELLDKAEENKVILNTPSRTECSGGLFPKSEFVHQPDPDTYTCPNDQTLGHCSTNHKTGDMTYRAAKGTCTECPLRQQCTTSKSGRTITRSKYEEQFERQREHAATPQAVMGRVLRGIIAEGKFGEAVRHGLKEMRYVGEEMAEMQSKLVAAILNFKRFLRIEQAGLLT